MQGVFRGSDRQLSGASPDDATVSALDAALARAEARLRESESALREAEQIGRMGRWELDLGSMHLAWSQGIFDLFEVDPRSFGASYEAFLGFVHPDDREMVDRTYRESVRSHRPYQTSHRLLMGDGRTKWVSEIGRTDYGPDGAPVRSVGIVQDITDQRRAEEERAHLESQLQQARKIEAIGRLAGGVAHDLNNLLSPVLGYGELLHEELPAGHAHRTMASEIVSAAERARELVRQLLAFARKQAIELKPVDLNEIVKGLEKMLRRTIREDVRIETRLTAEAVAIRADVVQVEQIIVNLAVNAQDAMPAGGALTLETEVVQLEAADLAGEPGTNPGPYVMLTVSDTGAGMDDETLERIFDPFFTTKELGKGTGLGLATVHGIVKQHGGTIGVSSTAGRGTSFRIGFPLIAARPAPVEARQPRSAGGAETVLVVEDQRQVREMVCTALARSGYRVLQAADGESAFDIALSGDRPIELLVTDVVMTGMNGRELRDALSAHIPGLKVLYMSGYEADIIARHGVVDEGVNFIQKPFSLSALTTEVRRVLDS